MDHFITIASSSTGNGAEVEIPEFSDKIRRKQLRRLTESRWLPDDIILCHLQLVQHRSLNNPDYPKTCVFDSSFYKELATQRYEEAKRDYIAQELLAKK
ncbi:hypothetical protein CAEBREN_30724 [Caenorhabditis brenneri]|uniref:Uncharacterized protein n=1 Tax=Caenorhabditis brenneri TaxID=135651 RepID=G0NW88_CAEBE|nr:hypothetical protein CAEBREN_30724 [Caenorhabditis brenneri]